MPESALGRGLEALIQDSQEEEEKKASKKNETKKKTTSKKKESKKKSTQKKTSKKDNNKLTPQFTLDVDKIDEIKEEVRENPRISLWSLKSAAVFKYMKKTIPEFSISNEASLILDEAIAKKYPEIWELFDDLE
ncbi:MAG: hypothetical protein E7Z86_08530 [Methanosphaera stadtmanae]|jgi:ribosomal protein S25|nr:hypothetical protein [Methanosphaera stadtmanae]